MATNKVIVNDETLIDLTADTASADTVLSGYTFHTAAGELATGTLQMVSGRQNLLLNSDFTDLNSVVDQRQGYVLVSGKTYYTNSARTANPVTVNVYTPVYYVTITSTYTSFRLSTDSSATLYYTASANIKRGYVGTGYGVDMLRGFVAADHYLLENDGLLFPSDTSNNGIVKRIPDFLSLSGKQLTLSVFLPSVTGTVTVAYASGSPFAQAQLGTITASGVHTFTFTVPDLSGKAYFGIRIYAASNTTTSYKLGAMFLGRGSGQTGFYQDGSNQWQPAWVQNYVDELPRCQRYFQLYRTQSLRPTYAADCRPVMALDPVQSTIEAGGVAYYANSAEP